MPIGTSWRSSGERYVSAYMRTSGMAGTLTGAGGRAARRDHLDERDPRGRRRAREEEPHRRGVVGIGRLAQQPRRVRPVDEHVLARRQPRDVEGLAAEVGRVGIGEARRQALRDAQRIRVAAPAAAGEARALAADRAAVAEAVADLAIACDQPSVAGSELVALEADEM